MTYNLREHCDHRGFYLLKVSHIILPYPCFTEERPTPRTPESTGVVCTLLGLLHVGKAHMHSLMAI